MLSRFLRRLGRAPPLIMLTVVVSLQMGSRHGLPPAQNLHLGGGRIALRMDTSGSCAVRRGATIAAMNKASAFFVLSVVLLAGCAQPVKSPDVRICDETGCSDRPRDSATFDATKDDNPEETRRLAALSDLAAQDPRAAFDLGMRFLRGDGVRQDSGSARLNLAGHDYQRMGARYLPGLERMVEPGALNMLLQHNPDVFARAAQAGFQAVISGHTHGGQINVEILDENVNVARFFTPFVRGRYDIGQNRLYVSCGLGTVGVPVRLGAPPEITLIKLCAV
jgi:hypothetical protein